MTGQAFMNRSHITAIWLLIILVSPARSAQNGDNVAYAFKGHLIQSSAPCTVNNNQLINVSFGNVSVSKVSSGQYLKTIDYTLDCGSATSRNTVSMELKATSTDWDEMVMASSVSGLGVRILNNSKPIKLNSAINIDLNHPPLLQAQLVTSSQAKLTEQVFTAGGTLIAEYQ